MESKSKFVEIEDDKGRSGWLPTDNLVADKTAVYQLADARGQIGQMQLELKDLRPLVETNKQLQDKFASLQVELQQLQEQNQIYRSRFNSEIFFAGGITVFAGIILGFIIGRASARKKNSGWS